MCGGGLKLASTDADKIRTYDAVEVRIYNCDKNNIDTEC